MFSCLPPGLLGLADLSLKWKANGVDISIDGAELEGMSTEHLQHMFDQHLRGSAGVPGSKEDFSDMSSKWQEVECDIEGEGFQVLSYFFPPTRQCWDSGVQLLPVRLSTRCVVSSSRAVLIFHLYCTVL